MREAGARKEEGGNAREMLRQIEIDVEKERKKERKRGPPFITDDG